MKKFAISTDSTSDMFISRMQALDITYIPMAYLLDGEAHYDVYNSDAEVDGFYKLIEQGKMPTTSMLNPDEVKDYFVQVLDEKKCDIVHFAVSGGLSGTADNTKAAAAAINATSEFKVYVVDSLAATAGIELQIDACVEMRDAGETAEVAFGKIESLKHTVQHWVIVDDLHHLKRGGRVSGASAFFGSILKIKPILTMDTKGKLKVVGKALGMKKAVASLMEAVTKYGVDIKNQTVYIANTTDRELEQVIEDKLKAEFGCKTRKGRIGPVVGSHTGCGTLSIMFTGKGRVE